MSKAGANGHYQAQKTLGTFLAFGYGDENNLRTDQVEGLKWLLLAKEHEPGLQGCEAMAIMLKRKMTSDEVTEAERRVAQVKAMRRPVR